VIQKDFTFRIPRESVTVGSGSLLMWRKTQKLRESTLLLT